MRSTWQIKSPFIFNRLIIFREIVYVCVCVCVENDKINSIIINKYNVNINVI